MRSGFVGADRLLERRPSPTRWRSARSTSSRRGQGARRAASSGCGERERPVDQAAGGRRRGSNTVSAASPAVETIRAVVLVVVGRSRRPAMNAPNVAGVPRVSDSVAGTVPPDGGVGRRRRGRHGRRGRPQDRAAELRLQALGVQAGDHARADQDRRRCRSAPWPRTMLALPAAVLLAVGGVAFARHQPASERIGGVGLLDDRVGAEVRVPDRREHERVRLGAVADRAAVVDDVGDAAGEARPRTCRWRSAAPASVLKRRAGGAEADDAAAAGQERVERRAVGRVQRCRVQRAADEQHVDVGRQRRGQRGRGDDRPSNPSATSVSRTSEPPL